MMDRGQLLPHSRALGELEILKELHRDKMKRKREPITRAQEDKNLLREQMVSEASTHTRLHTNKTFAQGAGSLCARLPGRR